MLYSLHLYNWQHREKLGSLGWLGWQRGKMLQKEYYITYILDIFEREETDAGIIQFLGVLSFRLTHF
jgi:hypothetical protein